MLKEQSSFDQGASSDDGIAALIIKFNKLIEEEQRDVFGSSENYHRCDTVDSSVGGPVSGRQSR